MVKFNLIGIALLLVSTTVMAGPKTKYFYTLKWEEINPSEEYELEVYRGEEPKPIIKKIIPGPEYRMELSRPAVYQWRVRVVEKNQLGPFSEFGKLDISDNILTINRPLMTTPGREEKVNPEAETLTFTWEEPQKNWTYQLQIFKKDGSGPMINQTVSGGTIDLPFKSLPAEFSWRISATSALGLTIPNEESFSVTKATTGKSAAQVTAAPPEVLPAVIPIATEAKTVPVSNAKDSFIIFSSLFYDSRTFELDVVGNTSTDLDNSDSFHGPVFQFSAEYLPQKLGKKHSLRAGFAQAQFQAADKIMSQTDMSLEYGKHLKTSAHAIHWFYVGAEFMFIEIKVPDAEINANLVNATGRYAYQKRLSERWRLTTSLQMLIPIQKELSAPSAKISPGLSYKFNKNWRVNSFLMAGMQTYKQTGDIKDQKMESTVRINNLGAGLGISWIR